MAMDTMAIDTTMERDQLSLLMPLHLDPTPMLKLILGMDIADTGLTGEDTTAIDTDTMDTMERDPLMKLPLPNLDPTLRLMLIHRYGYYGYYGKRSADEAA